MPAPFALSRSTSPAREEVPRETRSRVTAALLGEASLPNFRAAPLSAVFCSDSFTVFSKVDAATATCIRAWKA